MKDTIDMRWRRLPRPEQLSPTLRRWLWFAALWLGGVATTALVGLAIKLWLS
ncbi:DUF2474 domain-containing protein [Rhodoligotrophos defluvii]|uniref:DUF2474 domain-containing protein n=1 Tax=Rhodoligotrophos defluvii TaxID=2561934 RepID=UPI001EF04EF1|nr:DUF2474 domain-containing protein [Rhodoligotrophos defluvii]